MFASYRPLAGRRRLLRRGGGPLCGRRDRLASGAATVPKGRPVQIDLRIFGSEGMLLLDIERERLELRRRDGNDEIVPIAPGDGAYECEEPLQLLVDLCRGPPTVNGSPGLVGQRAVEVLDAMYRSAASGRMEAV